MGMISGLLGFLFGNNRNVVRETAEVFRENAEARAERSAELQGQSVSQFGSEFHHAGQGAFNRFMDGLNRLPRPALALGTIAMFLAAMVDPIWFAARMQGIALVPEPLWWLLGVIVSFYFGARHQIKAQEFQREISSTMLRTPVVIKNIQTLEGLRGDNSDLAGGDMELSAILSEDNPALEEWQRQRAT